MAAESNWPEYRVASRDILHALGVVAVQYAELDLALSHLFSAVLNIRNDAANQILSRTGRDAVTAVIEAELPALEWPYFVAEGMYFFIKSFRICNENRNNLAHSMAEDDIFEPTAVLLTKFNKHGRHTQATVSLADLRRVADETHAITDFGFDLDATICGGLVSEALTNAAHGGWPPLPDTPPLPQPLRYKSPSYPKGD